MQIAKAWVNRAERDRVDLIATSMNQPGFPQRTFTFDDQEQFAALSGDRNPIHLNPLVARRTQAGAPVVHGVHQVLWTLEEVARLRSLKGLRAVTCRFNRFVYLDVPVALDAANLAGSSKVQISADGEPAATVKLDFGEVPEQNAEASGVASPEPFASRPRAPTFDAMAHLQGRCIQPGAEPLALEMFPALAAALGAPAVAAFAASSGVVGMLCPGLHSLFAQLTLRWIGPSPTGTSAIRWRTTRTDARTRWVALALDGGGWTGEATCLARQEPSNGPSMPVLERMVARDEFAGRRALIVGGSRGLGAATAKILAAGGASVAITYAKGRDEAAILQGEIQAARGEAACSTLQCDVLGDVDQALAAIEDGLTHLYYFATPKITRSKASLYDRRLLDEFLDVYVDGFWRVWKALSGHGLRAVLYPSTVFLTERQRGMSEYVMAKAAGEALCTDLARSSPRTAFNVPRIPRVLTDQTATSPPVPNGDPVEVLLPILRTQP